MVVVRLSGPDTARVGRKICRGLDPEAAWRAQLVRLQLAIHVDDEAVAVPYSAPRSYTGEDMLELTIHGSPYLVESVVEAFVGVGCRRAEPGELTRRAVANGKMDLIQAEGIRDLIAAETAWQARAARARVDGRASRRLREVRELSLQALAIIEAPLDLVEQGVEHDEEQAATLMEQLCTELEGLARGAELSVTASRGLRVVLVGDVNAGKSTLFNMLAGEERAIVSAQPGTTRDVLETRIHVGGRPIVLVDTAGLRSEGGSIEAEGVRRARAELADADAVLWLHAVNAGGTTETIDAPQGVPVTRLASRADLKPADRPPAGWHRLSALTGEGLDVVRCALEAVAVERLPSDGDGFLLGRRHGEALGRAASELRTAPTGDPELAAEALRWCSRHIDEVLGSIGDEDVLDRVFETFCVGK